MLDLLIVLGFVVCALGVDMAPPMSFRQPDRMLPCGKGRAGKNTGLSMAATQFAADKPRLVANAS